MLAAVIAAKSLNESINDIKKIKDADLIELRIDYLKEMELEKLKKLIENCKKPLIITNRKKSEGGFFNGSEEERIQILKKTIDFGAPYIDIEYSSNKNLIKSILKNKNKTKIIISCHNFEKIPNNLANVYNNIKKLNPDLIKIVTQSNSVIDNFKIFDLIKIANKEKRKIIAFCMSDYGQFSRVLSIIVGSKITYGSIDNNKKTADGQLMINELVNYYRIKKLNKNTKVVGLIGNPVEHSWSHIIHNAAFDKLKINAVYLKFKVDKLEEFIEYFRRLNILGFSVTIPHKVEVIKYLDEINEKAKIIGAVNTIAVKDNKLIGYNTDCDGAIQALKQKTSLKNKNVVLLGAGGSTRALAYGLKEEGANIIILNRTIENALKLAKYFNCNYGSLNDLRNFDYDILINTTSVGMYPKINNSIVPMNLIKKDSVVFDIVFNPFKTKLLQDAERKGCAIIHGFEMLIHGAILQFKLWTGKNAPEKLIRKKVLNYINNANN